MIQNPTAPSAMNPKKTAATAGGTGLDSEEVQAQGRSDAQEALHDPEREGREQTERCRASPG